MKKSNSAFWAALLIINSIGFIGNVMSYTHDQTPNSAWVVTVSLTSIIWLGILAVVEDVTPIQQMYYIGCAIFVATFILALFGMSSFLVPIFAEVILIFDCIRRIKKSYIIEQSE